MSKNSAKAAAERLKKQQQDNADQKGLNTEASTAPNDGTIVAASENDQKLTDDSVNKLPESEQKNIEEIELKDDAGPSTTSNDTSKGTISPKLPVTDDNKLVQVEFVGPYKRYSRGDIASFSKDLATEMIEKGAAILPGGAPKTENEPV